VTLPLQKSAAFKADVVLAFDWYLEAGGERVAWRFFDAVSSTLADLAERPGLRKARRFSHPELQRLRSFRTCPPFHAHLTFYRNTDEILSAERLMHGRRDLPRRLREPSAG
jgi:plasmid stabilization system protein ParE